MKGKIIYVDFLKKHRITFIHFLINKIVKLIFVKFNIETNNYQSVNIYKNKRISK